MIRTRSLAVFACTSKACAPPPVGTGGSNPSGAGGGSSSAGGTAPPISAENSRSLDGRISVLSYEDMRMYDVFERPGIGKKMAVAAVTDEVMSNAEDRKAFEAINTGVPANLRYVVEEAVNKMLADWAESSNDGSHSQMRQAAAIAAHGLEDPYGDAAGWAQLDPEAFAVAVALTRAEYRATQKFLAEKVPSGKLLLARGVKGQHKGVEDGDEVEVQTNALSSWSTNLRTARSFGARTSSNLRGVTLMMEVPISQVQSTWRTGRGCMSEFEAVLIGHPSTARVLDTD